MVLPLALMHCKHSASAVTHSDGNTKITTLGAICHKLRLEVIKRHAARGRESYGQSQQAARRGGRRAATSGDAAGAAAALVTRGRPRGAAPAAGARHSPGVQHGRRRRAGRWHALPGGSQTATQPLHPPVHQASQLWAVLIKPRQAPR